jgi:hypothetical protein
MAQAVINGRHVVLPDTVTDGDVRRAGGIDGKRNLMRRTREGNFLVGRGSQMQVSDGDVFVDAPARVKGAAHGV